MKTWRRLLAILTVGFIFIAPITHLLFKFKKVETSTGVGFVPSLIIMILVLSAVLFAHGQLMIKIKNNGFGLLAIMFYTLVLMVFYILIYYIIELAQQNAQVYQDTLLILMIYTGIGVLCGIAWGVLTYLEKNTP